MRLVRITTRIYPDLGGPAKHSYYLSKSSASKDLQVITISCLPQMEKKRIKEVNINENFKIIYLPFHAPKLNANIFQLIIFFVKFFIYGLYTLIKIHKQEKVDLVHAHTPSPSGYIAFIFKLFFNVPYVYTIHGIIYDIPFLFSIEAKITSKIAKDIIVISRKIGSFLEENLTIKKRIHWIPNGVDPTAYYHSKSKKQKKDIIYKLNLQDIINQDDFIITYIGYMIFQQKVQGMIDFLRAYKIFLDQIDNQEEKSHLKLLYIGDGKFFNLLNSKRDDLKLTRNVYLLGHRQDVKDILAISDLSGLTSYNEGFPNVVLEYMASSVPCIGSDVGEIKSIINDAGFIIKPGDINAISECIIQFYNSKELRKSLTIKSREIIENKFDWKIIANKVKKIYLSK